VSRCEEHTDELWKADFDDFVGKAAVSDVFTIDTSEDPFPMIFEWDDFGEPVWCAERKRTRYEIRRLIDFDPITLVLRSEGQTVGFYASGMCWIDPAHRGHGLAVDLIRAFATVNGSTPNLNHLGFSRAGWAAHAAAYRASVADALRRGYLRTSAGPS